MLCLSYTFQTEKKEGEEEEDTFNESEGFIEADRVEEGEDEFEGDEEDEEAPPSRSRMPPKRSAAA